jgi:tetratricopeptide (TPR) repeat protein
MNTITKISLTALMLWGVAFGQTIYDQFNKAIQNDDTAQMTTLIRQIQASDDVSPERYIAEFNYYFHISDRSEGPINMSVELPDDEGVTTWYTLKDSTGAVSGYIYGIERYDRPTADSGLTAINKGIERYPDRLDMRFGKIHVLGKLKDWQGYTDEILQVIERTKVNNKQWVFPNNTEPADTILIYSILEYEKDLFDQCKLKEESKMQDAVLLGYMRDIATHMLELYPKDIFSMNIMAVTYNAAGNLNNALIWLKKAEQIAPKDVIVLSNLADTYHNMGDYANEKKCLKKILKYGDEDAKAYAKYYLKQLP